MFTKQKGQSLIEVLIALTITVVMIVALIAFVLSGLKNAQFAQTQSKATKIASETMEQIKTIRDRNINDTVSFADLPDGSDFNFSDLWTVNMSSSCVSSKCYFGLHVSNIATENSYLYSTDVAQLNLGNGFKREIIFEDSSPLDYTKEKRVTVNVYWTDSSGEHNTNVQTILSPAI